MTKRFGALPHENFAGYALPRLILGAWQYSPGHHEGQGSREELVKRLSEHVASGVTCFDCADIYGGVEELLGEVRKRVRARHGPELARSMRVHTKFVPDLSVLASLDRDYVRAVVERSLQRLGVEALDLVQFHWWDYSVPRYAEAAYYLHELKLEGKILNLGVTNFDTRRLAEIFEAGVPIVSAQVQFSLLDRRALRSLTEFAGRNGISLLAYGSLAGGYFSERYLGLSAAEAAPRNRSQVKYSLIIEDCGGWERFQELLRVLQRIASSHAATIPEVTLAALLRRAEISALIVGGRTSSAASPFGRALSLRLGAQEIAQIESVCQTFEVLPGEVYELEREREGKHGRIMRYNLNQT